MSNVSNEKDNNAFINCSNIENSALKWSFIDKILNKIDEVEAKENFCKDAIQAYDKAGFVYFLDSKTKETTESSHIEIPLISDNEYLCSMSKLFSTKSTNNNAKDVSLNKKQPETKLIDSFFNMANKVNLIVDEINKKDCEELEKKPVETKESDVGNNKSNKEQEVFVPSTIPELNEETIDSETVATFGTSDEEVEKNSDTNQ